MQARGRRTGSGGEGPDSTVSHIFTIIAQINMDRCIRVSGVSKGLRCRLEEEGLGQVEKDWIPTVSHIFTIIVLINGCIRVSGVNLLSSGAL